MRPQPLICVRDVEAGSRWYQRLLGCQGDHGGAHYERLVSNGRPILQLQHWDVAHHHGAIGDSTLPAGNGVLLWLEVDDFDAAVARAAELRAHVVLPRHRNPPDGNGGPNTGKSGCAIRMAIRSCLRVPTDQPMAIGSLEWHNNFGSAK